MAYAGVQDIIDRYGPDIIRSLTRAYDGAEVDARPIELALDDASAEIDLSLRPRVDLPLASVPPVITRIAVDLALASLPTDGAADQDLFQVRAKAARQLLGRIASGDLDLGVSAHAAASDEAIVEQPFRPVFGNLRGY